MNPEQEKATKESTAADAKTQSPVDYLLQMEERVKLNGATLPSRDEGEQKWVGVCCGLMGLRIVIALDTIAEVVETESLTAIPGCCDWVMGVMNMRGRLLPVFSVSGFLAGESDSAHQSERIIALDRGGIFCGLAMDSLQGMQKFPEKDFSDLKDTTGTGIPDCLSPYIRRSCRQDDEDWYELDIMALAGQVQTTDPSLAGQHETITEP